MTMTFLHVFFSIEEMNPFLEKILLIALITVDDVNAICAANARLVVRTVYALLLCTITVIVIVTFMVVVTIVMVM